MTDSVVNESIDTRIQEMLIEAKGQPLDVQVKVVNAAISWEKVKHGISDDGRKPFNPDDI